MDSLFFRQINPGDRYKHCSIILSSRQLQVMENNLRFCLPYKPIKLLYPCSFTVVISFVRNHFKVNLKSLTLLQWKIYSFLSPDILFSRFFFARQPVYMQYSKAHSLSNLVTFTHVCAQLVSRDLHCTKFMPYCTQFTFKNNKWKP